MYETRLIDAEISEKGISDCERSVTRTYLQQMDLQCVIVSPLRRCMQTAYHLLKDHPSFSTIQFVLLPYCREHLHTSGDVPLPLSTSQELARSLFPTVDTESYFSQYADLATREAYFLETLDEGPRQQIKFLVAQKPEQTVSLSVCEVQREHYLPDIMESMEAKLARAQKLRDILNGITVQPDKKVVVVAHSVFAMTFIRTAS